jgi:sugar lactone lactonase YvrE
MNIVGAGVNNGIALSEDGQYAWVAETFRRRIVGVSLEATDMAEPEPCLTDLPGYPDNLDRDDTGLLWGALFAPPNRALETLRARPGIAKAVARLTGGRQLIKAPRHPRAFAYDPEQHALEAITFEAPRPYAPLTTVRRVGQHLYLASIEQSTLAIAALPAELSAFADTASDVGQSG